jgi:guanine deaminase
VRQPIKQWMVFVVSFFLSMALYAEQKSFYNVYDDQFTHMNAFNCTNTTYSGMPKKLTAQEYKALPKTWDGYCPACTLKDKNLCQQRPCQEHNLMLDGIYEGIQSKGDPWMIMANEEALKSIQNGGGPFGAVIVQIDDPSGKVIRYWVNHNHVAEWTDPTAHAEVTTIRSAAKELGVTDLGHINKNQSKLPQPSEWSHCVIYSSTESCPMCLSAIYWAGIKSVAFSATLFDAAVKGVDFSDKMIYEDSMRPYSQRKHMSVVHSNTDNSLDAFNYYKRKNVARYGAQSQ